MRYRFIEPCACHQAVADRVMRRHRRMFSIRCLIEFRRTRPSRAARYLARCLFEATPGEALARARDARHRTLPRTQNDTCPRLVDLERIAEDRAATTASARWT